MGEFAVAVVVEREAALHRLHIAGTDSAVPPGNVPPTGKLPVSNFAKNI